MTVYGITFSPTGGTDKVTELLMEAMDGEKKMLSLLSEKEDYSKHIFKSQDICFIAVPSFGGRVPQEAVKRLGMMKGNQARAVLVCVYGNRAYEDTLMELKDAAREAGFVSAAAVAAIAEHSIMHRFAQGRPDETDQKELREYGQRIREYLDRQENPGELNVPGNHPYKELGTTSFIPKPGKDCNSCGRCAALCPVGAIDPDHVEKVDEKKCISCMRCIAVCPKNARSLDRNILCAIEEKMAKLFETRKENELFLGENA